ncbi:MAG: peptidyl-tRNA hydrolase Pth2 [Candidatus Poseidoniaceae archaeon]
MGFRSFLHRITAPKFQRFVHRDESLKMVFIINHDLKMGKGKIAAQVGHAAVKATLKSGELQPELLDAWLSTGQKKICVKADDARHIEQIEQQAKQLQVLTSKIYDAGHTQIPAGSLTVLALGPEDDKKLDTLTGELKLL